DKYDTAVLVSGDEDFSYAINAVAYKGVRVELAGFRSNTSPRLIDVADQFIELDSHLDAICKTESRYNHYHNANNHHTHYVQTRPSGALNTGNLSTGNLNTNHLNASTPVTGNLNANNLPTGGFVRVHDDEHEAQPADERDVVSKDAESDSP